MKKAFLILIMTLMLFSNIVLAATEQDVINALNASYTVGGEQCRFPQSIINKGMAYINSKDLTPKQCDKLLGMIGTAVSIAQKNGTTDITKIPKEDLKKLGISSETSNSLSETTKSSNNSEKVNRNDSDIQKNSSTEINPLSGENSGEHTSGEIFSGEVSGETIINNDFNISSLVSDKSDAELENIINRNMTIAIVVVIFILFILFFIIYLLFKSKWNKIAKYILIIIFVIVFLVTLIALCVALAYWEEIGIFYKLYYILK